LLACFGVDAIARSRTAITRLAFLGGGLVALGTAAIALSFAWPTVAALYRTTRSYRIYPELMVCWAVAIVVVVVVLGILFSGRRAVALVVATLLVLDSSVMFTVPMLAAPREVTIDTAPVRYLARHLGYGRFFSLGILQPNYGSYFGLASADVNDLPVPRPWANYVTSSLDPNTIATIFNGSRAADPTGPSPSHELLERLSSYEQIGVRFVMVRTGARLFGRTHHLADGVREVFRDSFATIYALPHPEPYFETRGQRCAIVPSSRDLVVTRCAQGSLLIRSEIDLPGWSVTVNGRQARLRSVRQGVTAVEVPKGTSTVSFTYEPAHLNLGLGLFGAGVLLALGLPLRARRRRHKRNEKGGEPESPDQSGAGTAGEPALTPTR
ncbi:MAG: YfhO family protein, partial [Acidimicrobiales bacterium]